VQIILYFNNGENLSPISEQNGSKMFPFGTGHTYLVYIREYIPLLAKGVIFSNRKKDQPSSS